MKFVLRGIYMRHTLTAVEIDSWAKENPRRAQEILPELIERLVLCTSTKIVDYNFPIENAIQYSGYDGVSISEEKTSYFPDGKSVWEFGTNDDLQSKFSADLEKRSKNPLGVEMGETTFIFATLKIWNHRKSIEELLNESRRKYSWKDIRMIDGCKIAVWLQEHTAVASWLATVMGNPLEDIRDIEDFWKDYCETTEPNLNQEFFLLGREAQIDQLEEWRTQNSGISMVIAESTLEAKLFVVAYLLNKCGKDVWGNVLIIESEEQWRKILQSSDRKYILMPIFNFTEGIQCPAEMKVILPVSKYSPLSKITQNCISVKIEKRIRVLYRKAVESIHAENLDVERIEAETKRSFLPFYRRITRILSRKQPSWLSKDGVIDLIPAFLVGSWDEDCEGDRQALELMSGIQYEEYIEKIQKWLMVEDAPIFKVLNVYQIVSVMDMWTFLYEFLTSAQVKRFKSCVLSVFGAEDPTFELPEEQWSIASIFGKKPVYSARVREGLTISLILLSEQKDRENNCNINSAEYYVDFIVKEILEPIKTWQQWNSIAECLPSLAEASPTAFLEKLETEIRDPKSELWRMFEPSHDFLTGRNYYTNILWALERLVWYKNYVIRAIDLLVKINERQIKYKISNSPINTLYEVFCIWCPQSCLNYEQRIKKIKNICKKHPNTGKELIVKLLPAKDTVCYCIEEPRWRSFETEIKKGVTNTEYRTTLKAVTELALDLATTTEGWKAIIAKADVFFEAEMPWLDRLLEYCDNLSDIEKNEIADLLRSEISRNRVFCNAEWAMSEKHLKLMESVLLRIQPDIIEQYSYLFKRGVTLLHPTPYDRENYDWTLASKQVQELRIKTAQELLKKYGKMALIDFAMQAEATEELSAIIVRDVMDATYDFVLLGKMKEQNVSLYKSALYELYSIIGIEKVFALLKNSSLSDEEKGELLYQGPLDMKIWDKIGELGEVAEEYYWRHMDAFRAFHAEKERQDYLLKKLIQYNRPFSAARAVSFTEYSNSVMILHILEKCCEMHDYTEPTGCSLKNLGAETIQDLFSKVYGNQNVDLDKLVSLEVAFFPCFEPDIMPEGLARLFQNDPIEYVRFIGYAYKKDKSSESEKQGISPEQAQLAYRILHRFNVIPGCNMDTISAKIFEKWVEEGSEFAKSVGLSQPFENSLGRLLSYAPLGSDGIFPHEIVREYFEKCTSTVVINGFLVGKYNQRGVHTVTAGAQEKAIAVKYRKDADAIRMDYPRTAAILDEFADSYLQESINEQKRELIDYM